MVVPVVSWVLQGVHLSGMQLGHAVKASYSHMIADTATLPQLISWLQLMLHDRSLGMLQQLLSKDTAETKRIFEKERENTYLEDLVVSHQTANALFQLIQRHPERAPELHRGAQQALQQATQVLHQLTAQSDGERPLYCISVKEVRAAGSNLRQF